MCAGLVLSPLLDGQSVTDVSIDRMLYIYMYICILSRRFCPATVHGGCGGGGGGGRLLIPQFGQFFLDVFLEDGGLSELVVIGEEPFVHVTHGHSEGDHAGHQVAVDAGCTHRLTMLVGHVIPFRHEELRKVP